MMRLLVALALVWSASIAHARTADLLYTVTTLEDGKYQYDFRLRPDRLDLELIIIDLTPAGTEPLFPELDSFFTETPYRITPTYSWSGTHAKSPALCIGLWGGCRSGYVQGEKLESYYFTGVSETYVASGDLLWWYSTVNSNIGNIELVATQVPIGTLQDRIPPTPVPLPAPVLLLGSGMLLLGAMRLRKSSKPLPVA